MKFNYKNICLAALAACSVTACDLDTLLQLHLKQMLYSKIWKTLTV